jgi:hypothetical protein
MKKRFIQIVFLCCIALLTDFHTALGNQNSEESSEFLNTGITWEKIKEGFQYNIKVLFYGMYLAPAESTQNPENDFLRLPTYIGNIEARPDFRLVLEHFDFNLKPRAVFEWRKWDQGTQEGETASDDEWYINEWLARMRVTDFLFVSYGRENIQWGPSFLSSPSNPFFFDNGKLNPKSELRGLDFARLVWIPGEAWTVSIIANMDKGAQDIDSESFEKGYALKLDYVGDQEYVSLVFSHKNKDRRRIGGFAGWTATDALIVYGEGMLQQGSSALYPVSSSGDYGTALEASEKESSSVQGIGLLGGSYTLETGPVILLEYIYNSLGYDQDQADDYYELRQNASDDYFGAQPLQGLSMLTLSQTADPGLRFLRKNYAMVQYRHSGIKDVLDLSFSYIHNIDDGSGRFISTIDYSIGDHLSFFSNAVYNTGNQDTEFGSMLKYQIMAGLEYTF